MSSGVPDVSLLHPVLTSLVINPVPNASTPPTITKAALANPARVTGITASLSVLASDPAGEPNLTYTWTVTSRPAGAAVPTFSANGTNAAKADTVTFAQAGNYSFLVTVADKAGLKATSSVSLAVGQTLTTIAVTPGTATVTAGRSESFTARAFDQFGQALATQPTFSWTATAGTITPSGQFTAPQSLTTVGVKAAVGSIQGSAAVTVADPGPTIATVAAANPSSATGKTANLSVLGADLAGESTLTYTWSVTSRPAGASLPTFSANATNAAKATTATFGQAGSYTFLVTATDPSSLRATSEVSVVVNQSLTTISVSPGSPTVEAGHTQTFTALALDQFGTALTTQPTFMWTTSGGTITTSGQLTAPQGGTSVGVNAAVGSIVGSASVNVASSITFVSAASADASPVTGTTVDLSALASEQGSQSGLTYNWSVTSSPSTNSYLLPSFSANGSNAAQDTTVTFRYAGSYTFLVTATDTYGNSATCSVNVVVDQTFGFIFLGNCTLPELTFVERRRA